ncbi:MAG: hypothetical protein AAF378_26015, partial [Cyanobacteria bacterium P01_A01_bin.84]
MTAPPLKLPPAGVNIIFVSLKYGVGVATPILVESKAMPMPEPNLPADAPHSWRLTASVLDLTFVCMVWLALEALSRGKG